MNDTKFSKALRLFALSLDPIHVGTGGMRLGRVDMTISREPGTNLPKIPGTSLAGTCRTYATMQYPAKFPDCAGQGQADNQRNYKGHCGQYDCPICVTFGFSKGEQGSFQGLAQFSDARLVFFPVHSIQGPVWVTCPSILKEIGEDVQAPPDEQIFTASGLRARDRLNLGWLMLPVANNNFTINSELFPEIPSEILLNSVLISDKLFSHIVNDNLEVRTSVSIDPQTGAAAESMLFTYEALPRASVMRFEVVISNPNFYRINGKVPLEGNWDRITDTVQTGLKMFEMLGIGGMNTRGMGRFRVLNLPQGVEQ